MKREKKIAFYSVFTFITLYLAGILYNSEFNICLWDRASGIVIGFLLIIGVIWEHIKL